MTNDVDAQHNYRRFLDPETLARLGSLDLIAKHVVEGFIAGLHSSPFHGFSSEFSEHRAYIPGDPLKHLDWKVLARTDRPYLKRFEDETNLQAHIILDRSGTMAYGESSLTKWDYARVLTASLAYMLLRQRDAVGLALFDNVVQSWTPARSVAGHLETLLREIGRYPAQERTDPIAALHGMADRLKRTGLVIVISDFIIPPPSAGEPGDSIENMIDRWLGVLRHFQHQGHDVLVLQVLDESEISFDFNGPVEFTGLEGEDPLVVDTDSVAHLYRQNMDRYLDLLARACRNHRIDYHRILTREPLDLALSACLDKRKRIG
jgi:hypothetical protein